MGSSNTDSGSADKALDDIYDDYQQWELNTGGETIHAKRVSGFWRNIKWLTGSTWLLFFLGYFVRWGDRQAIFFDIGNRQFHIFNFTILPQDFWMLSLLLLFFALLLAASTALFGRIYCGFFCFQTIWTDVFTWIEGKLEGVPAKRRKLDKAKMDFAKFRVKFIKHSLWLIIGFVTGVSFVAWFYDGIQLWKDIFSFQVGSTAIITISMFTVGTYVLAGFLREQTCFWLCPYARIQAVMIDTTSAVVTYDFHRGEPRGRLKKGQSEEERTTGDCVECLQCIAVCPTGVDIRHGSQEGCINCALCIDACDAVMKKINRPTGLIRYESLDEIDGREARPLLKRPRVWIYGAIMSLALLGIAYGLSTIDAIELKVLHDRQPLFVLQSDGSIQNKYILKILNKIDKDVSVTISATGPEGLKIIGADKAVKARHGNITPHTVFVRVPGENLKVETQPIVFHIVTTGSGEEQFSSDRESIFIGPRR